MNTDPLVREILQYPFPAFSALYINRMHIVVDHLSGRRYDVELAEAKLKRNSI